MYGESNMGTYISICKIDSQGVGGGWGVGGSGGRGHVDAYGWLVLLFGRKQQNSVKQLSFN